MKKSSIREQRPSVTARETAVATPAAAKPMAKRPDFAARLKEIYGDKILPTTGAEIISELRGER
jgi:uncharacterized protein (DUF697 family)